jgi:hypothetical protein
LAISSCALDDFVKITEPPRYIVGSNINENGELIIKDKFDNYETVSIANESYSTGNYEMFVNLFDLKLVLDSCKADHITVNCGNHRSIVVTRGPVANLIPEVRKM